MSIETTQPMRGMETSLITKEIDLCPKPTKHKTFNKKN